MTLGSLHTVVQQVRLQLLGVQTRCTLTFRRGNDWGSSC